MQKRLFDDFSPVSAKEWKQKIQYELKGADYNAKMVWESPEGIKVKPFYTPEDYLADRQASAAASPLAWKIAQLVGDGNEKEMNTRAHRYIAMGAESLIFDLSANNIDLKKLLADLDFNKVVLHFNLTVPPSGHINSLRKHLQGHGASYHIHFDPIAHLSQTGNWYASQKEDLAEFDSCLSLTSNLCIDSTRYQNAGAHMVQQLAYALAHANEYLNLAEGKSVEKAIFKVAVGGNYFFEISKLKALRKLWKVLTEAYGIPDQCHIIAGPTLRNKTLYAPKTNILRTTTEYMAAILGGADTLCPQPYDSVYDQTDNFSDRIALNQLLLLKNESHFDTCENPATGSYYIESLTEQLAQKALALFKQIEASGGFLKQLKAGTIQKKIRESAQKEQQRFDKGEEVLVGINAYRNTKDKIKCDPKTGPFAKQNRKKTRIEPLIAKRLAEKSEIDRLKKEG